MATRITFLPTQAVACVPRTTTLFDAGAQVAAGIETACVGKGTCGLCRVRVVSGEGSLSPYTDEEVRHIGNVYHLAKLRLACRTQVIGDEEICVEVVARRKPAAKRQNLVRK